ncbi:hypothetical protein [Litorivivens sp.]|uniref:hypothetical protein n=1 Tax=Litorivivens sp. TaxID=2020868 RepID=UPI003566D624
MRYEFLNKFNRGEIDPHAELRIDVAKIANSAGQMTNWIPLRLGPMQYRPGTEYLGGVLDDNRAYFQPFVSATDNTALLEFTDDTLRPWVDGEAVQINGVTTEVANGDFSDGITDWIDISSGGGSATPNTDGTNYDVSLIGDGTSAGGIFQAIDSADVESGVEHFLKIVVGEYGTGYSAPVNVQIHLQSGNINVFNGELTKGTHYFVFTPISQINLYITNRSQRTARVSEIQFAPAGDMAFATGVPEASISSVRCAQSADVLFCASDNRSQFQVLRRGQKSWAFTDYLTPDGPFGTINTSGITMTASALTGEATLTASGDFFVDGHVGALMRLASASQTRTATVTAADAGTGSIRVTGTGDSRAFAIARTGTWVGTVTLQRSADDVTWSDVETYTGNGSKTFNDELPNATYYYRLWVKAGDYTSGSIVLTLTYDSGSIEGVCRIVEVNSLASARVDIISELGSTDATQDWYLGEWNGVAGYPTAVTLFEGRLWWAGKDKVYGSVSDAFRSYDTDIEGNSRAIQKTIGFGPVDDVNWLSATSQLVMGVDSDEILIRSSSFGEVITQNNANLRGSTNQGSAAVEPVRSDNMLYFVQRSGQKIIQSAYSVGNEDLTSSDVTILNPSICAGGIARIAVARQPETRIFAVLNDGTARVYLVDPAEEVSAWSRIETDGLFEDVVTLPGVTEDRVYFVVNRDGSRYLERMALFEESVGGNKSNNWDSFVEYTSPGAALTGLDHLNGKSVAVWADGQDLGDYTVSGGSVSIGGSYTDVCAGLRHTAQYISNKLNTAIKGWVSVNQNKRVTRMGIVAQNMWGPSIRYGDSWSTLYALPAIEEGTNSVTDAVISDYDYLPFEFDGVYDTKARVHIQTTSPATILAMVYEIDDPSYTPGAAD